MAYIVTANTGGKINLAPKTREEEILQNVRFLLSTPKFTVTGTSGFRSGS